MRIFINMLLKTKENIKGGDLMAKPIISGTIVPFDARYEHTFKLSWSGNRSYGNRVIIYKADNLSKIYDRSVTSYILSHTLPANTLVNGEQYIIQCQIIEQNNMASVLSDKILFYTFESPSFYFSNIVSGQKIESSSYTAIVHYSQSDLEEIESWKFYLYAANKSVLHESKSMYGSEISYTYRGLESGVSYYIRCQGVTRKGIIVDTGLVDIYVYYKNPSSYSRLYAVNDPIKGYVKYDTNIIIIQYNGNEVFQFEDGKIDLTDKSIYYDKGFTISGDFTLIIRGTNLYQSKEIFVASNDNYSLKISSYIYDEGKLRFKLTVPNGLTNYILYSDEQVFDDTDMVTIWVRRINNIYQMHVFIEYDYELETASWYGDATPSDADAYDYWIENGSSETVKVQFNDNKILLNESEPVNLETNNIWLGGD